MKRKLLTIFSTLLLGILLFGPKEYKRNGWRVFPVDKEKTRNILCDIPRDYPFFSDRHAFPAYFDFEEGIACAKEQNKPILLYITGFGVVNSYRMNQSVLADSEVIDYILDNFIPVILYSDDRRTLPNDEFYCRKWKGNKEYKRYGSKQQHIQMDVLQTGSQPSFGVINPATGHLYHGWSDRFCYTKNRGEFLEQLALANLQTVWRTY